MDACWILGSQYVFGNIEGNCKVPQNLAASKFASLGLHLRRIYVAVLDRN